MGASRRIDWRCDLCGEPLEDGAGYATVPERDVRSVQQADREMERRAREGVTARELFEGVPPRARWQFRHFGCDPAFDRGDYWIDIAKIRTEADLLIETARLMEKEWLDATNWADVIRDAASGRGSTRGQQAPPH